MPKFERMHLRPEDAIRIVSGADYVGHLYSAASGPKQDNEISITHYDQGASVGYHLHKQGYETFILDKGRAEVFIGGKKCIIEAGDMVNIEPHMPHGFRFLEQGSAWRELFQELNLFGSHDDRLYIANGNMQLLDDPDFLQLYRAKNDAYPVAGCAPVAVDKSEMPMIIPAGEGVTTFHYDSLSLILKVGRWGLNGNKEVWEYASKKKASYRFGPKNAYRSIYYVCQGRVRVTAAGRYFTAEAGDFIDIPQFTPFILNILEADTVLNDFNCKATLFELLEEVETERVTIGQVTADRFYQLCQQHGFHLEQITAD